MPIARHEPGTNEALTRYRCLKEVQGGPPPRLASGYELGHEAPVPSAFVACSPPV